MPVLGLDFGTSTTVGAFFDDSGQVVRVQVRDDVHFMPSVVCFHGGLDNVLVGESAALLQIEDPEHTVVGVKRFLGRRFRSDYVNRYASRFAYGLAEDEGGRVALKLDGELVPLEYVASKVIARVKELATAAAGEEITEVVLACPAHFHFRQRESLREAARLAGLQVMAMINEPTAAAFAEPPPKGEARTVLVYDLGGGTFDTTVLRVDDGIVEVMASGGDAFLGGNEFDDVLMRELATAFQNKSGIDLRDTPVAEQRLAVFAEKAKIQLSTDPRTRVRAPCIAITNEGFHDLDEQFSRARLEQLCAPLIERTIGVAQDTLKDAGVALEAVDEVLLVGGQCEMPRLRARVTEVFGESRVRRSGQARESVAIGAARAARGEDCLLDVLSVPICAMYPGAMPTELVPANSPIPARVETPIGKRDQDLHVIAYEALNPTAIDREILGKVTIPASVLTEDARLVADLDAAYGLALKIVSSRGEHPLELTDPSAPRAQAPRRPEESQPLKPAPVNLQASTEGAPIALDPREELARFTVGVKSNDIYRALDIEALTPTPKALERVSELAKAFQGMANRAGPDQRAAASALKILQRIAPVIRAPNKRVAYDFGHDHVHAEERLDADARDAIFNVSLLQSTWRAMFPDRYQESIRHRQRAQQAVSQGDRVGAADAVRAAVANDPFDTGLRTSLQKLSGS